MCARRSWEHGGAAQAAAAITSNLDRPPIIHSDVERLSASNSELRQCSAGGNTYSLFVTPTSALFVLAGRRLGSSRGAVAAKRIASTGSAQEQESVFRIEWVGGDVAPLFAGSDLLPGQANHFAGNDPQKRRTHESLYGNVRQSAVYPGIDQVTSGRR